MTSIFSDIATIEQEQREVFRLEAQPGPQQFYQDCQSDVIVYGGSASSGKALELDTDVLTTKGWSTIGDILPGDYVFDEQGKPTLVTEVSPIEHRESYMVVFHNGSEIVCSDNHLWSVSTDNDRRNVNQRRRNGVNKPPIPLRTLETKDMVETMFLKDKNGNITKNYQIPKVPHIQYPEAELPLDPYLLGLWLADGTTHSGRFSNKEQELFDAFVQRGFKLGKMQKRSNGVMCAHVLGMTKLLHDIGVFHSKHIPDLYMRSSYRQRFELLQGIMDGDGTCTKKRRGCSIAMKPSRLIYDVIELVYGLGCIPHHYEQELKFKDQKPRDYKLEKINFFPAENPFKLKRKADKYRSSINKRKWTIHDIKPVGKRYVKCLTVANPSHMFLVGEELIPTHNSYGTLIRAVTECLMVPDHKVMIFRKELQSLLQPNGMFDELKKVYNAMGGLDGECGQMVRMPTPEWRFPNGSSIKLGYLNGKDDHEKYQSSQMGLIVFEEATELDMFQMVYVGLSRNRSTTNMNSHVCFTCNPSPDHPLYDLIAPWANPEHKLFPVPSQTELYIESTDPIEIVDHKYRNDGTERLSITFIGALPTDNQIFMKANPRYEEQIRAMGDYEYDRLYKGLWTATPPKGPVFDRDWIEQVESNPNREVLMRVRAWDTAGSAKEVTRRHDFTVGLLMSIDTEGIMLVEDIVRFKCKAGELGAKIKHQAILDGVGIRIALEQELVDQAQGFIERIKNEDLKHFIVYSKNMTNSKLARARDAAFDAERGFIKTYKRHWTRAFLNELSAFKGDNKGFDDQVDAMSLGHYVLRDMAVSPDVYRRMMPVSTPVTHVASSLYGVGFAPSKEREKFEDKPTITQTKEERVSNAINNLTNLRNARPSVYGEMVGSDDLYWKQWLEMSGFKK